MLKSDYDTTIFHTLRMRIKSHTRVHITHTYLTAITRPGTGVPEISRVHQVTVITAGRTIAVDAATYFIVLAVARVITIRAEFARFCEGNSNYSSAISSRTPCIFWPWWRHQMETFSALLAISAGNSPVPGDFPAQRPVTRSFDAFFDLRPNKRLSKPLWGWWFETPSRP